MAAASSASLRPTRLGMKGAALFATLELAFLATSYSNLFFLLLAFCAVLGAAGAWWTHRNLRGLEVVGIEAAPGPAGRARPLTVVLRGQRRTRFGVAVALPLAGGHVEVAHAGRLTTPTVLAGTLPARPRGVEAPPRVRLISEFPFGLFRARRDVPCAVEIVSWPAPEGEDADGAAPRAGDGALAIAGRGAAIAGLRGHRTGDALADVHWKATARRDALIVKEREREADPGAAIVLDRRCGGEPFEAALRRIAGRVVAVRHRRSLRVVSQEFDANVDPERGGATAVLRWLAAATPLPPEAPPPPAIAGALRLPIDAGANGDG